MRRTLRRATSSGYGRTAVVALATMALLASTWGSASGAEAPPAVPFNNGTAKATATVARVAPGVGNLQLGISSGVAVAQLQNTVASAQAETLDLGLLGSTLTAESCGTAALVSAGELPQPVTVDSRKGAASASADQVPLAGTTLGGGHKEAHANPSPASSDATATLVGSSIPGLLTLDGGKAEATTQVKDQGREAHARVTVGLNIAGLLNLSALTWDAFHRTGKDPKATASFDLGTGSLLGLPLPAESETQLENLINSTLASTGLSISFPHVERFTTPADLIRMTPLTIELQDTPAGKDLLGPVLNLTRAQRTQLFNQIATSICQAAAGLLVGDIGLDIVSGTGFLLMQIGGAEATTGDLVLDSPFGTVGPAPSTSPFPSVLPTAIIPPSLPNLTVPGGALGAPAQRTSSIGPLVERCQSAHPTEHTACSKGALLAVGLVGLLATAGVGGLDWRHQRKRRARAAALSGGPAA